MRRVIAAAVCLAALLASARAQTYSVTIAGGSMLLKEDGTVLVAPGEYDGIWCISGEECPTQRRMYAATVRQAVAPEEMELAVSQCALLDANGRRVGGETYDNLVHDWKNGTITCWRTENGLQTCGLLNEAGEEILPCDYLWIVSNQEGGYLAAPKDTASYDEDGSAQTARLAYIAPDGARRDTDILTSAYVYGDYTMQDGLMPLYFAREQLCGYVDARGEVAIEPAYERADAFFEGMAAVRLGACEGLLRADGTWALEPVYQGVVYGQAYADMPTFCAYDQDSVRILARETLEECAKLTFVQPETLFATAWSGVGFEIQADGETIFLDQQGARLFRMQAADGYVSAYVQQAAQSPQRLVFSQAGDWLEARDYLTDLNLTRVAGPYLCINYGLWWEDGQGRYLISAWQTATRGDPGEEYVTVLEDSFRYGVIDQDGNEVFPLLYNELTYLGQGRYWVRQGDRYRLVDERGEVYYETYAYFELMD